MDAKLKKIILGFGAMCSESDGISTDMPVIKISDAGNGYFTVSLFYKNIGAHKTYYGFPKLWKSGHEINKLKWNLVRYFKSNILSRQYL